MIPKKKCSKCKISKDLKLFYSDKRQKDGLYAACKECHLAWTRPRSAEWMRKWRKENPEKKKEAFEKWNKANPEKVRAHLIVWKAVKMGKLKRKKCEVCRAAIVHAHHEDYSKPLIVRWLCPIHHKAAHAKLI